MRMALVNGPTPPGTGEMAPTTARALAKSTSPTMPSSTTLMPTSTTDGPELEHGTGDQPGHAGRHDDDVRGPRVGGQVPRPRVADGHRRVLAKQEQGRRLADDVASPDDDGVPALDGDAAALEELDGGLCRGRQEPVVALGQQAGVLRVEPVDVLGWVDGIDHPAERDVVGQGHLDDDPVDRRIVVQRPDLPPQLVGRAALGQLDDPTRGADVLA